MIRLFAMLFSLSAQAGLPPTTLSGQSSSVKPTTFTTQVPYNQATQLTGTQSLIETGNENMLVDPNMESSGVASWTCTAGTCTKTTTAGEFTSGKSALKVATNSVALNVSQSVSTTSGIQTQGVVGVAYKVPSAVADFQVCSLVAGSEQTCAPSTNLINDGLFHSIEIPVVMTAGSSVGIKFKTTATSTQNFFFDAAYVKQGIGFQNLSLDNVYSASISNSGVVTQENKDFINGNCSGTNPFSCTLNTGIFSLAPNCVISNGGVSANVVALFGTISTSTIEYYFHDLSGNPSAQPAKLVCQKQGTDYLAASANVYSQSSANYTDINAGAMTLTAVTTSPTKGTIVTDRVIHSRTGQMLIAQYQYEQGAAGSTGSGDYLWTLPNSLSFSSSVIPSTSSIGGNAAKAVVGYGQVNGSQVMLMAYNSTQFRAYAVSTSFVGSGSFGLNNANLGFNLTVIAPISGWSNANLLVGSFSGVPSVPGGSGLVDIFSASYGVTDLNTACSSSPCLVDQIGSAISSMTRSSTGTYPLNFNRTYSKVKCVGMALNGNGNSMVRMWNSSNTFQCAGCSSITVRTVNDAGANIDSLGNIQCIGSY